VSQSAVPAFLRQFLTFFAGSAAGLLVDLGGFWFLVNVGLQPWLANATSSVTSITVVYLLVTRYTFGVGARPISYVAFVAWYCLNIALFSIVIQLLSHAIPADPFLLKLASVPLSFVANFLFSRLLFARLTGRLRSDESESERDGDEAAPE
jgi:putative flippase GtrA